MTCIVPLAKPTAYATKGENLVPCARYKFIPFSNIIQEIVTQQMTHLTRIKPLTRIFRHSWCEDPIGGQELPYRKSCCLQPAKKE